MPKTQQTQDIEIDKIDVSSFNTRKDLEAGTEDSTIDDLGDSIAKQGYSGASFRLVLSREGSTLRLAFDYFFLSFFLNHS